MIFIKEQMSYSRNVLKYHRVVLYRMYDVIINTTRIDTKSNSVRLNIEFIGFGDTGLSCSDVISGNMMVAFPPQVFSPTMFSSASYCSSGTDT